MNDVNSYLEAEVRKYFPDAHEIDVSFDEAEETWTIDVLFSHPRKTTMTMNVGSDDSWFTFRLDSASYENVITIPSPEWLGE